MLQETIVYGVIKGVSSADEGLLLKSRIINCDGILDLGEYDHFPYLCTSMFSIPGATQEQGTYQTQVIHFAASYQAVEYQWQDWMNKFERLLKKMYWVSVKVHLETELQGTHLFTWESNNYHQPGDELSVRCEWEHETALGQ